MRGRHLARNFCLSPMFVTWASTYPETSYGEWRLSGSKLVGTTDRLWPISAVSDPRGPRPGERRRRFLSSA